jgi:DNA-binding NarL/FixJ family response regulator
MLVWLTMPGKREKLLRKEGIALENSTLGSIGFLAIAKSMESQQQHELSQAEMGVLLLASYGWTAEEVAEQYDLEVKGVELFRDGITQKLESNNMAQAVGIAIKTKLLTIEERRKKPANIDPEYKFILSMIAEGKTANEIAEFTGKSVDAFRKNRLKAVFRAVAANGMVHSVRRGYELGIFQLDD